MNFLARTATVLKHLSSFLTKNPTAIIAPVSQIQNVRWSSRESGSGEVATVPLRRPSRMSRDFQAKSPFRPQTAPYRYGYENTVYSGGLLPRHKSLKDKPVFGQPIYNAYEANAWTRKKALFGQNDYIDILGDGRVHPYETMKGPEWLKGFTGNELQRIVRQLEFAGTYLRDMRPMEYHLLQKRLFFLFKRMNRRVGKRDVELNPEKYAANFRLPARYQSRFNRYYKQYNE